MIRKLLTKPIWWWERKRSYPVRGRHVSLPSLPVKQGPIRFVVLTTPAVLQDAMWTAWSWYRYLGAHGFELQLAVDGELPDSGKATVHSLFPGISIFNVNTLIPPLCARRPSLGRFLQHHPCAKQVALVLALSRQTSVLYSDHDVLAFNQPEELLSNVRKGTPCYFMDDGYGCHDPLIVDRSEALGLGYIPGLNAGFLYVPEGSFSHEIAEQLLVDWGKGAYSYFTPQTVQSVLMSQANAQPLPRERYVVSARRQFYWQEDVDYGGIVARHFTGTVRHVMYRAGMPAILRQNKFAAA